MIEDMQSVLELVEKLLTGTETSEDREAIASYIRSVEERMEFTIEVLAYSRDRYLKKAAAMGDQEAQEWLNDRENEILGGDEE